MVIESWPWQDTGPQKHYTVTAPSAKWQWWSRSPDLPGNMPFFFISMDSINLLGLKFDEGALPAITRLAPRKAAHRSAAAGTVGLSFPNVSYGYWPASVLEKLTPVCIGQRSNHIRLSMFTCVFRHPCQFHRSTQALYWRASATLKEAMNNVSSR